MSAPTSVKFKAKQGYPGCAEITVFVKHSNGKGWDNAGKFSMDADEWSTLRVVLLAGQDKFGAILGSQIRVEQTWDLENHHGS